VSYKTDPAGIILRAATAGELPAARALFGRAFGRDADEERWRRKYFENPAGPVVAFGAFAEDRLVSFVALHPARFVVRGEPTVVYAPGDSMTDPDFRLRGFQVRLKSLARDWSIAHGVSFIYSFPNTGSRAVNKRAGYSLVGRFTRWARGVAAYRGRVDAEPSPGISRVDPGDPRLAVAWEQARGRWAIAGVRDGYFLAWRFADRPVAVWLAGGGDPRGYVIAERTRRGVWIRDLVAARPDAAVIRQLLAAVTAYARAEGARHVVFAYRGGCYRGALMGAGFAPLPGGARVTVLPLLQTQGSAIRRREWFLTDADRDLENF